MDHVAVLDDVILAFQAPFAGFARAGFAVAGDEVVVSDDLGADEAALEVGVDDTGALRRRGPDAHRPGYDIVVQAMSGLMATDGKTDEMGIPLAPASLMLIFHAGEEPTQFTLPAVERGEGLDIWEALLTTDTPDGAAEITAMAGDTIDLPGRTVMLFVAPGSGAALPA